MTNPTDTGPDPVRLRHSNRFRTVADRYPRRVAEAYDGDIARADGDTDEQVAATVAAWELANGYPVRDWRALGTENGRDPERRCAYPSPAPVPDVIGSYLDAGWTVDGDGQWHPPHPPHPTATGER